MFDITTGIIYILFSFNKSICAYIRKIKEKLSLSAKLKGKNMNYYLHLIVNNSSIFVLGLSIVQMAS